MNKKALSLFSGGLDSILATRIMVELGVETIALHYHVEFAMCGSREARAGLDETAKMLGVPLKRFDITEEYLEMFKSPRHGYGSNINPCIDCKIFMLKKAKEFMASVGASFLVTGEVLGERPMSQRKDALNIIERDAGVRGILLRPLSAKLLKPTKPEEEGIVDREKLFGISGRSRKEQFALAERYGIKTYPTPAGGCLLTDPAFTRRVKDLIEHRELTVEALRFLKHGRHFRIAKSAKLAIGRNEKDNDAIEKFAKEGDMIFIIKERPGPFSLLKGVYNEEVISKAASLMASHSRYRTEGNVLVEYWITPSGEHREISVPLLKREEIEALRI